jgi:alpha-N-acetylglucosamine transferase
MDDSPFPGWWSKIDLFQPGRFKGRVLYLDLDVTVVGALDDLVDYPYPFCAIRDYQYPLQINSSVMAWDAGMADCVYNDFTRGVMERLHGDQNFIHEKMSTTTFPKQWCPSYKKHVLPSGKVSKDARVIVYHGSPRPWEVE